MMKNHFFAGWIAFAMVPVLLMLSGCHHYRSHYKAVAFVHSNTSKNASMNFSDFEGTMVFQLKCDNADERIRYSAKLESGSAKVCYDCNGTKTELFSVNSGDDISAIGGTLQQGTVYLIVETSEKGQNGRFNFDLE